MQGIKTPKLGYLFTEKVPLGPPMYVIEILPHIVAFVSKKRVDRVLYKEDVFTIVWHSKEMIKKLVKRGWYFIKTDEDIYKFVE